MEEGEERRVERGREGRGGRRVQRRQTGGGEGRNPT